MCCCCPHPACAAAPASSVITGLSCQPQQGSVLLPQVLPLVHSQTMSTGCCRSGLEPGGGGSRSSSSRSSRRRRREEEQQQQQEEQAAVCVMPAGAAGKQPCLHRPPCLAPAPESRQLQERSGHDVVSRSPTGRRPCRRSRPGVPGESGTCNSMCHAGGPCTGCIQGAGQQQLPNSQLNPSQSLPGDRPSALLPAVGDCPGQQGAPT